MFITTPEADLEVDPTHLFLLCLKHNTTVQPTHTKLKIKYFFFNKHISKVQISGILSERTQKEKNYISLHSHFIQIKNNFVITVEMSAFNRSKKLSSLKQRKFAIIQNSEKLMGIS